MKKIFEKIIEGILTCSGFVTSITILLIVLFLFTEAFGLFNSKVIEEGYVLALNKGNKVNTLSPAQIKDVFDEEITNWKELGWGGSPYPGFSFGRHHGVLYGGRTGSGLRVCWRKNHAVGGEDARYRGFCPAEIYSAARCSAFYQG